jgi:tetratricopeptide (TPR) repeat protein
MRAVWTPIIVSFLIAFNPCLAQAGDEVDASSPAQRAETHSRLGVEYYQSGLYKEAVREMMLAYEAVPDATLLYNVARIYQKMGQADLAVGFFKRFVSHEGANPNTVKDALGHMEALSASESGGGREATTPVENIEEVSVAEEQPPAVPPQASASPRPSMPFAAIPVAVAGASFGAMAITGALAVERNEAAKDVALTWENRTSARSAAEDLALVADISLGVGVAASVASVIALIAQKHRPAQSEAAVFFVPAGPTAGLGLTVFGRLGGSGGLR